ncbi:MAG: DUF1641 domain-containing protein [Thermodesulfobacteriota bacterium]|nr:DUF1641 domain-containing protein [Thermodesulfobacteriota bacterium]
MFPRFAGSKFKSKIPNFKRAAEIPGRVDPARAKEVGLFGMMSAMSDHEIKQGMGILLELTRGLTVLKGRHSSQVAV